MKFYILILQSVMQVSYSRWRKTMLVFSFNAENFQKWLFENVGENFTGSNWWGLWLGFFRYNLYIEILLWRIFLWILNMMVWTFLTHFMEPHQNAINLVNTLTELLTTKKSPILSKKDGISDNASHTKTSQSRTVSPLIPYEENKELDTYKSK